MRSIRQSGDRGFSLVEVLIMVGVVGVLSVMVSPYLADTLTRKDARIYAEEAMDALREAQSSVMSGRDNARWGVHFEETRFALFSGASYVDGDPGNIVHELSGQTRIVSVSLSPGGSCAVDTGVGNCDVHFVNSRGTPTEAGSIVVTADDGATWTVTLNDQGMIDVE